MIFNNDSENMKKRFNISAILVLFALTSVPFCMAFTGKGGMLVVDSPNNEDTTIVMRYLPGEIRDTTQYNDEMEARREVDFRAKINVLTRTYGDSVVLRWAAEDYATWRYLNRVGVNIVRMDEESLKEDTLVLGLKPATLEQLRALYGERDSVAGMAMGALYDENMMAPDQTNDEAGSMGSLYDISQEQQMKYAVAVLVSEWRQDLANLMAMRFTDRTAKKGHTYSYFVRPTVFDSLGHVPIRAGIKENVENVHFKPEPFDVEMSDSIAYPDGVYLYWTDRGFSSYEVERRMVGGNDKWKRLNERPYIIMNAITGADCFYSDHVDKPGTYEYRVMAHDPFGELTKPSPTYTVTIRDMTPPLPPRLTWIEIDRRNENEPDQEIYAHIHFVKDTMEADFAGCVPMYYHERITEGKWRPLVDKPLAPADTMVTVNVTNLVTGQIVVAAYDTAQNVSYSIPQLIRVSDMKPPLAPQGLKAYVTIEKNDSLEAPLGLITLKWDALKNDDIDYYEVAYANDSTHEFMSAKNGIVNDTIFVDTVAVDVNQKYICYKVRAVDYSTNIGEFSDMLQVIRPSAIPPTVAHLDSSYVDGKGIFMRWVTGTDEQMAYHNVYRRLIDSQKEWTLLRRCDADSVKACNDYIDLTDVPRVNSNEEYVYAVESFNYSGISSGLSLQFCTRFVGDAVFEQPIKLFASYDEKNHLTHLVWETDKLPEGKDWYFCIWRQGPDDDRFKFLLSADADENDFTDYLLEPGQTAYYFVQIQMEDGRESEPSNIVVVRGGH